MRDFRLLLSAPIIFGLLVYQNCAKVHFLDRSNPQYETVVEAIVEEAGEPTAIGPGPTNGDGYEGKLTRYFDWDEERCGSERPRGEIQKIFDVYELVVENCDPVPARLIPPREIEETEEGILYSGNDYRILYPESCQDIYQGGGDNPNGLYWLDSDGYGGADPFLSYCDMTFISAGWGSWGDWSDCSVDCGQGEQSRERSCRIAQCTGDSIETRSCQGLCL